MAQWCKINKINNSKINEMPLTRQSLDNNVTNNILKNLFHISFSTISLEIDVWMVGYNLYTVWFSVTSEHFQLIRFPFPEYWLKATNANGSDSSPSSLLIVNLSYCVNVRFHEFTARTAATGQDKQERRDKYNHGNRQDRPRQIKQL